MHPEDAKYEPKSVCRNHHPVSSHLLCLCQELVESPTQVNVILTMMGGTKAHSTMLSSVCLFHFCAASRPVENKLCQGLVPEMSQLCQIPCPTECEVSLWGAWGPCTFENCDDQAGSKGTESLLKLRENVRYMKVNLMIFVRLYGFNKLL